MIPSPSARFTAAMQGGYRIATRCELWNAAGRLATVTMSAATVTIDRQAQQRRRGSFTLEILPSSPLIPTGPTSYLAPYGNELRPFFGVTYADGSTELVPIGVFPFTTTEIEDTGSTLTVSVDAFDRSWTVAGRKMKVAYSVAGGTDPASGIKSLINSVYPGLTYSIEPSTGLSLPAANFQEGSDPWAAALTLAEAIGYELYFDVNGTVIGRPIPSASSAPTSWNYADSTATVASARTPPEMVRRRWTRDGISNDFIVSGVGTGNTTSGPVRAASADNNSSSPTWVGGLFGDVPTFITSTLVTSTTGAQAAADNALAASLAEAETIHVRAQPNPLIDLDDVIGCYRSRVGLNGARFVVDNIKHTLRHDDSMVLGGRRVA